MQAVKFVAGTEDQIEGLGLPFGGPFNGRDLDGEKFTPATQFHLDWFDADARPVLFQHGLDKDAGATVVGRVKSYELKTDLGVWTRCQLDASSQYFEAIKELIQKGKLFFSSGAMAHLVDVDRKSGEIKRWPWVELSLTPTPANLFAALDFADVSKHFKAAGLVLPETLTPESEAVKAEMDAEAREALDDADFAYIDGEGGRHLPMQDAAHARAALARFDQTDFESDEAKEKAHKKLVARCKELGIEVSEEGKSAKLANTDMPSHEDHHAKPATKEAMTMAAMRAMAKEMDVELSDEDMQAMMDKGLDEEECRAEMEKRRPAKSVKAVAWEDIRQEVEALCRDRMNANPFGSGGWCYVERTFSDHVVMEFSDDMGRRYFMIPFTIGPDGHVTAIGTATEVEETYTPKTPAMEEMPMAKHAELLTDYAAGLMERTKDLRQRRLKEGRVLSGTNRKRLETCVQSMTATLEDLQALLDATEPQPAKAASVERYLALWNLYLN